MRKWRQHFYIICFDNRIITAITTNKQFYSVSSVVIKLLYDSGVFIPGTCILLVKRPVITPVGQCRCCNKCIRRIATNNSTRFRSEIKYRFVHHYYVFKIGCAFTSVISCVCKGYHIIPGLIKNMRGRFFCSYSRAITKIPAIVFYCCI